MIALFANQKKYFLNLSNIYRWWCDEVMTEGEGIEVCQTVGTLIVKIRTQSDTMYQHPEIRHNDKGFYYYFCFLVSSK